MTSNLIIDDIVELQQKSTPQNSMNHRVYYIGRGGICLGGSPISGRFPWRNAESVVRRILRAWARDIVARHDTTQLATILHQWARDWSSNNDDADTNNGELLPLENILSSLIDKRLEHKAHLRQIYGSRGGSVMSHLSEEMIEAVGYSLIQVGKNRATKWVVDSLDDDGGIYRIILRGGEREESV